MIIDKSYELKECPFCGADEAEFNGSAIECQNCGAQTMGPLDEKAAVDCWNMRAGVVDEK